MYYIYILLKNNSYNEIGEKGAGEIAGCMSNSPNLQNLLLKIA